MSEENKTVELKEKDLDVIELDDDLLESVIGGIASLQLGGYPSVQCSKCKKSFSLGDFGYNSLGYGGSVSKFKTDHESICNG